jgi:hypothetical protein
MSARQGLLSSSSEDEDVLLDDVEEIGMYLIFVLNSYKLTRYKAP